MKTKSIFISAIVASVFFVQLNAQTTKKKVEQSPAKPAIIITSTAPADSSVTISFDKYKHDFGTINGSDGKVTTIFTFTNLGDSPLLIANVTASCGCTTPEWTREPVLPGEQGYVKVSYNPTSLTYFFDKPISVYSNGNPSKTVLSIIGTVVND